MRLEVDSGGYDSAAEALDGGNHVLAGGYTTLTGKLGSYSAMAGDDISSEDFVKNYDSAAAEAVAAFSELTTAYGNLAIVTSTSGANHRAANRSSVYGRGDSVAGDETTPQPEVVSTYTPPSALGGDNADMPEFWNLIVDHLQGYAWPGADTGKLREAASAWRTAAGTIDRAPSFSAVAASQLGAQRSPEIPSARAALREVGTHATDLAAQCREIATACDDYAEQVDQTRQTIKDLVRDLAIEIGATAVVSGVLSFVTFGGAAAVGAGVATARAISCAGKIIKVLAALKVVRAVGVVARSLPKLTKIRAGLKKFLDRLLRRGKPPRRGKPGSRVPTKRRPKDAPDDWPGRVADNGKGDVWQKPGSLKDADSVRVMDPTDRYPNGYVRYYNKDNQPIGLDGKPGSKAHTHIPKNPDGSWPTPDGWNP